MTISGVQGARYVQYGDSSPNVVRFQENENALGSLDSLPPIAPPPQFCDESSSSWPVSIELREMRKVLESWKHEEGIDEREFFGRLRVEFLNLYQYCDWSNLSLSSLPPSELFNESACLGLDISNNEFSDLSENDIDCIRQFKKVVLTGNPLTDSSLEKLNALKKGLWGGELVLDLDASLRSWELLEDYTDLEPRNVISNHIFDVLSSKSGALCLKGVPDLKEFMMCLGAHFDSVRSLDLSGMGLFNLPRGFISLFPNITFLDISNNAIGNDGVSSLMHLDRSVVVNLSGNSGFSKPDVHCLVNKRDGISPVGPYFRFSFYHELELWSSQQPKDANTALCVSYLESLPRDTSRIDLSLFERKPPSGVLTYFENVLSVKISRACLNSMNFELSDVFSNLERVELCENPLIAECMQGETDMTHLLNAWVEKSVGEEQLYRANMRDTLLNAKVIKNEYLQCTGYKITELPPVSVFLELPNLKELYLDGNALTDIPDSYAYLSSRLRVLSVSGNPISEANIDRFLDCVQGQGMCLSMYHSAESRVEEYLDDLPSDTNVIVLDWCNLSRLPSRQVLERFECVEYLMLAGNHFEKLDTDVLDIFPRLKYVDLFDNPLSFDFFDVYSAMRSSRHIEFNFDRDAFLTSWVNDTVGDERQSRLSAQERIRRGIQNGLASIKCDGLGLSQFPPVLVFYGLPFLRTLDFSNNNLEDLPISYLGLHPRVNTIRVTGNQIRDDDYQEFYLASALYSAIEVEIEDRYNEAIPVEVSNTNLTRLHGGRAFELSEAEASEDTIVLSLLAWGVDAVGCELWKEGQAPQYRDGFSSFSRFLVRLYKEAPLVEGLLDPEVRAVVASVSRNMMVEYEESGRDMEQCVFIRDIFKVSKDSLGACIDRIQLGYVMMQLYSRRFEAESVDENTALTRDIDMAIRTNLFVTSLNEGVVALSLSSDQGDVDSGDFVRVTPSYDQIDCPEDWTIEQRKNEAVLQMNQALESGCVVPIALIDEIEDALVIIKAMGVTGLHTFKMEFEGCITLKKDWVINSAKSFVADDSNW